MSDNVIIVTGGGRGIGRAVCKRFAADGAQIVAAARTVAELEETQSAITREGGRCHIKNCDLGDRGAINDLIEETVSRFGRVDVLVNAAGVAPLATIDKLDAETFDLIQRINVDAVFFACRVVWPVMVGQGGGVIINFSSMASVDPFPGLGAYGAAKAWVNAWTKGLAEEGRSVGVRVFAVAPGAVETKMLRDAFPDFPAEKTLPPEEVAELVHALAQPACRYATGQTVFVRK